MSDAAAATVEPPAKKAKRNAEPHVWTLLRREEPGDWEDYLQGAPDISVQVFETKEAALDQMFDEMKSFLLEQCEGEDSRWSEQLREQCEDQDPSSSSQCSKKLAKAADEMLMGESPFSFVKHCSRNQMEKLYDWINPLTNADMDVGTMWWEIKEHGTRK